MTKTEDYEKRAKTFKKTFKCKKLIKELNQDNKICPICGREVNVGIEICPSCGYLFGNKNTETHIYSNQLTRAG